MGLLGVGLWELLVLRAAGGPGTLGACDWEMASLLFGGTALVSLALIGGAALVLAPSVPPWRAQTRTLNRLFASVVLVSVVGAGATAVAPAPSGRARS